MSASIRLAVEPDIDALVQLRRQWVGERRGEQPDPAFADRFRAWLRAEWHQRRFWLAEDDGAPVGMANLLVFTRMPTPGSDAGRWGYLGNMFVVPHRRDTGIGRRLLDAVLAHADREGLVRVVLSPSDRSVSFYRRAGFVAADELLVRRHPQAPLARQ